MELGDRLMRFAHLHYGPHWLEDAIDSEGRLVGREISDAEMPFAIPWLQHFKLNSDGTTLAGESQHPSTTTKPFDTWRPPLLRTTHMRRAITPHSPARTGEGGCLQGASTCDCWRVDRGLSQSDRSAAFGSARDARIAGMPLATTAMPIIAAPMAAYSTGSFAG